MSQPIEAGSLKRSKKARLRAMRRFEFSIYRGLRRRLTRLWHQFSLKRFFAAAYVSSGESKMIINQIGIEMSANTVIFANRP